MLNLKNLCLSTKFQVACKFGVIAIALAASHSARAAAITWGSATTASADTDVSTAGTLKWAINYGGVSTTINGVTFSAGTFSTGAPITVGDTTITPSAGNVISNGTVYGNHGAPFINLSSSYKDLLKSGAGASNLDFDFTVTIANLTIGSQYSLQAWVNDDRAITPARFADFSSPGGNTVTLDYNTSPTNDVGGIGQFSIGTFTADATSQTFTITVPNTSATQLNALQLRTLVEAPEPSSLILMAIAMAGITRLRRKQLISNG